MIRNIRIRIVGAVVVLLLMVAGVSTPMPTLAAGSDGPVMRLCGNAFMFNDVNANGGVDHFFTVHANYFFRIHVDRAVPRYDSYDRLWVYGHSYEAPANDGWILSDFLCELHDT